MQARGAVKLESLDGGAGRPSEEDILAAAGRGDHRAAIELCVTHHGEAIGRLCMSLLGSQQDAEAVTQETLVEGYQGLASRSGDGSVRSWLLGMARRKCARRLARLDRRTAELRQVGAAEAGPVAGETDAVRQRAERARALLGAIRPSEREALVMRYGAGLSLAELGVAFDTAEEGARQRVARGIAALRERLQQEGQER